MKNYLKSGSIWVITLLSIAMLGIGSLGAQEVAPASAENPSFHRLELGLRYMPTFSSFEVRNSSDGVVEGEATLSHGFGGALGLNFTNHAGLKLEAIYNELSQKYKDNNVDRRVTINYINVPVLLSLNTGKENRINLNIVIGPQVGINVGSDIESDSDNSADSLHAILAVKQADFGFAYGAGLEVALNPSKSVRLDLGFRGVYGLIDISDSSQTKATDSYYILDRTSIQTYAGYLGIAFLF